MDGRLNELLSRTVQYEGGLCSKRRIDRERECTIAVCWLSENISSALRIESRFLPAKAINKHMGSSNSDSMMVVVRSSRGEDGDGLRQASVYPTIST